MKRLAKKGRYTVFFQENVSCRLMKAMKNGLAIIVLLAISKKVTQIPFCGAILMRTI
jgi:hypothetical protein